MRITAFQKFSSVSVLWLGAIGAAALLFITISGRVLRFGALREDMKGKIAVLEEKKEEARRLSLMFREHQSEFDRMEKFFVDPRNPVEFVEQIESLGRATGNSVSLLVDEGRSDAHSLLFSVEIKGARENLLRMARALEMFPYSLAIEEIRFAAHGVSKGAFQGKKETAGGETITLLLRASARDKK